MIENKGKILASIRESQKVILNLLESVSDAFFEHKISADDWSIAQIIEHLIKVESGVIANLQRLGLSESESDIPTSISHEMLIEKTLNRDIKVQSPSQFIPNGLFKDKALAINAFLQHREQVEFFIKTTSIDMRNIGFPHPRIGMLNGENWLTFIAGHGLRHAHQIKLIKERE